MKFWESFVFIHLKTMLAGPLQFKKTDSTTLDSEKILSKDMKKIEKRLIEQINKTLKFFMIILKKF